MRVEEVKTSFIADTQKYIKDIQKAQKVLNTFLNTNDMTKKEKAENRLQVAIQKRAQAQAKALTEELKLKRQVDSTNTKLVSSQNNVNKSISKSTSSSKMFGGELAHLARNVMTLYYSVKSLGKVLTTGIDFNKTKENARLAFTVMFRSADVASKKIQELQEYAIASPLSFKETISASKQLSAYGFAAEELVPAMEMLGTVAKATGHSLDDIAYVYGTLRTQGQAYARDLMQFSMRGIPIYEELAEVLKVDQKEIKQLVTDGKVGFKEVEKAFKNMTKEGGKFGGLLDEWMKGSDGIASQLEDTFQQSMGQMTEPMFEALKTQMKELIRVMDSGGMDATFRSIGEALANLTRFLGSFMQIAAKLLPIIIALGSAFVALLVIQKLIGFFKILPQLLVLATNKMAGLTLAMNTMNLSTWTENIKGAFTYLIANIKALGIALKSFAIANPWFIALIAGTAAITVAIQWSKSHLEKMREEVKALGEPIEVARQDVNFAVLMSNPNKAFAEAANTLKRNEDFKSIQTQMGMFNQFTYEGVKKLAAAYGITERQIFDLLKVQNMLYDPTGTARAIALQEDMTRETERYNKALADNRRLSAQTYLADKTGKDISRYQYSMDSDGKAVNPVETIQHAFNSSKNVNIYKTIATQAGKDYVAMFNEALAGEKEKINLAYALDPKDKDYMAKLSPHLDDFIKEWISKVQGDLEEGAIHIPELYAVPGYGYDEYLRDLLKNLEKLKGIKLPEIKLPEIKLDPWFDREKMASATKMIFDDLELQRDKDLANAQAKLDAQEISFEQYSRAINAISEKYRMDRMQAEKDEMDSVFDHWKNGSEEFFSDLQRGFVKAIQAGKGVGQAAMGLLGGNLIQGSEIGNIVSGVSGQRDAWIQAKKDDLIAGGYDVSNFNAEQAATGFDMAGSIQGGVITQAIQAFAEMALSVENVQKVIDPFGTMMEAAGTFLKPLLSVGFSGIASVLKEMGEVIGKNLLPMLMPLMINLQTIAGIIKVLIIPILQTIGAVYAWLYDYVLVPFGNAVIDLINGIIDMVNMIPWINIEKLERFQTTAEMLADSTDSVNATMQYMLDKLNKMIDDELQSLQDLYEVGAISGAELQARTDEANLKRLSLEENLIDVNVAQMEEMQAIYDWLVSNGAFPDIEALLAAPFGFADGTSNIPYDMVANVHKGEGIIPATFMNSIRAGELMLSAGNTGGGGSVSNYYITVEGSVTSENDLADSLAEKIEQRRTRGYGRK